MIPMIDPFCTTLRTQVEMVPEVEDSVAIGLRVDGDVEVILFVKLVAPTADAEEGGEERAASPPNVSNLRDGAPRTPPVI